MTDPFLAAHELSVDVYTLAGRVPVSIRDQILRAHYLIERLFSAGKLAVGTHLAVIGAGAAGASVAILAARRGAKVKLLEAARSPFRVQRSCTTRWIDPVQYDWPATHAEMAQWPIEGLDPARIPLGFEAGPASKIASQWTSTLNKQRLHKSGNLVAHFGAKLSKVPKRGSGTSGSTIDIPYKDSAGTAAVAYADVVVIARGIAAERTYVEFIAHNSIPSLFIGPLFWSNDGFEDADFGLRSQLQRPLLVSGSGDGALQDYIRLVSGQKSAIALLNTFRGTDDSSPVPGEIRRMIYEAEQEAQRCLIWNDKNDQDHHALAKLHAVYLMAIDEWVATTPRWRNVTKSLNLLTSGRDVKNLRLYHRCTHFSQCYPLNHLLALALNRYIFDRIGQQTIKGNTSLMAVEAPSVGGTPSHVCSEGCWNKTHEITYGSGATCSSGVGVLSRKVMDGVIVRHGLRQHTSAKLRRHLLPLHLF